MNKETRNLVIGVGIALVVGFVVGSALQTGRCPISGMVVCKDRAAACDKMKACAAKETGECDKEDDSFKKDEATAEKSAK
ncbi:MAG: hypothetical protein EXS67_03895 [Candidatus Margulisbacteria bacterium]|nr:hypothetical protein [Candidatus Margulisiibacteriota bacterium]